MMHFLNHDSCDVLVPLTPEWGQFGKEFYIYLFIQRLMAKARGSDATFHIGFPQHIENLSFKGWGCHACHSIFF